MRRLALLALLAEAAPKPLPLVPRGGGRPRDANAAFFGDLDGVGALCEREATPGINLGEAVGRLVRLVTALRSLALVAAAAAGHSAGRANARKDARAEAAYADSVAELEGRLHRLSVDRQMLADEFADARRALERQVRDAARAAEAARASSGAAPRELEPRRQRRDARSQARWRDARAVAARRSRRRDLVLRGR